MEKQRIFSLHFSLPNQFLLLVVPPLQESMGVLELFWLELHTKNSWKSHFLCSQTPPQAPNISDLYLDESYSSSCTRQPTLRFYSIAIWRAYSPSFTSFSPHILTFKLAAGDKKTAILAWTASTNLGRDEETQGQCWYHPGEMDGVTSLGGCIPGRDGGTLGHCQYLPHLVSHCSNFNTCYWGP